LKINRFAEPDSFVSQISTLHFCMHLTAQTVNSGTAEWLLKNVSNYIINTVHNFIFVVAII